MYLAPRRQAAFGDTPSLHFSPIEPWLCRADGRYFDIARRLAIQNSDSRIGNLFASILQQAKRATDDAAAKIRVVIAEDGCVRRGMKPGEHRKFLVYCAGRVRQQ